MLFGFSLFSFLFSRTSGDKELTVSDDFDNSYNKLMFMGLARNQGGRDSDGVTTTVSTGKH